MTSRVHLKQSSTNSIFSATPTQAFLTAPLSRYERLPLLHKQGKFSTASARIYEVNLFSFVGMFTKLFLTSVLYKFLPCLNKLFFWLLRQSNEKSIYLQAGD